MKLIASGLAVNYHDEGDGPVALLLHGWGSNLDVYDGLAQQLSRQYRVVRFDWPGFGGSEPPNGTWGIEDFAKFCVDVCHKLSIEPAVVIGHSMGGQTAVYLVGQGLLKPHKLILLAASAIRSQGLRETAYKVVAKVGKSLVRNKKLAQKMRGRLYQQTGTTDYLHSGPMQSSYRVVVTQDQRSSARHITIPTLLVWGSADDAAPLARGQILAQAIPHARLEVVPQAGHYVFIDEPEQSWRLIEEFLHA